MLLCELHSSSSVHDTYAEIIFIDKNMSCEFFEFGRACVCVCVYACVCPSSCSCLFVRDILWLCSIWIWAHGITWIFLCLCLFFHECPRNQRKRVYLGSQRLPWSQHVILFSFSISESSILELNKIDRNHFLLFRHFSICVYHNYFVEYHPLILQLAHIHQHFSQPVIHFFLFVDLYMLLC